MESSRGRKVVGKVSSRSLEQLEVWRFSEKERDKESEETGPAAIAGNSAVPARGRS